MIRGLTLSAALLAGCGVVCLADDPPARPATQPDRGQPAQPERGQPGQPRAVPAQPGGFATTRVTTLARYEEEAEVLDAQLDIKKAYVKSAEVGVMGTKVKFNRLAKLAAVSTVTAEDVELAKLEMEAATAHLDIRKAEMKEVELKVKYAKKRLEDAKNAPFRVSPARPPVVDPKPAEPRR